MPPEHPPPARHGKKSYSPRPPEAARRRRYLATTLLVFGRLVDVLLRVVLHVARVLLRVAHLPLRVALGLIGAAVRVQRVFDAIRRVRRVVLHVLHRVAFREHRERKADGQRGDDPFPHSIPPGKCRPDGRRSSGKLRTRCPLHNDPEESRVTVPSAGCWPARACRTESASPRASACRSAAPSRRRAATTCRDRGSGSSSRPSCSGWPAARRCLRCLDPRGWHCRAYPSRTRCCSPSLSGWSGSSSCHRLSECRTARRGACCRRRSSSSAPASGGAS